MAVLMVLTTAAGCAAAPTETTGADTTGAKPETESETEPQTETETETETEPVDTTPETYDPALDNSALEKNEDGNVIEPKKVDPTTYVAIDGLGRELVTNAQTGDVRANKTVGIFYSPWHGEFANSTQAVNNQEILDKYIQITNNNGRL